MTYSKEVTLWCDENGCSNWERFDFGAVQSAVTEAQKQGWAVVEWNNYRCPSCSNE